MDGTLLITGGTGSFGNAVLRRFLRSDLREIRIFSPRREEAGRHAQALRQSASSSSTSAMCATTAASSRRCAASITCFTPLRSSRCRRASSTRWRRSRPTSSAPRTCSRRPSQRGAARGLPQHRQGGVPDQRHGHLQGDDGKGHGGQVPRAAGTATVICGTRYGNVMASRGSVIPLFVDQVPAGQPITITDPNMTRFMMTLDDAVDLVLYAFEHGAPRRHLRAEGAGRHGRHAGAGAARADGHARTTRCDVIGTRHGEKLYETLLSREEMASAAGPGRLLPRAARPARPELRQVRGAGRAAHLACGEDYNSHNTDATRRAGDEATCC